MAFNSEPEAKTHNPRIQLTSGLLYVAQISGIVTVIAGTIYVLGLFALLLPILNKYDVNFDTAWYMVSLTPNTMIAGLGVKSLVWPALLTVIPIAFIVVMVLVLMALVLVGVRRARHHANIVDKDEPHRGVPLITAVYLAYSAVLGVVLLAMYSLIQYTNLSVPDAFFQFHVVAAALAYGLFALLCLLTLSLLTWRAGRYVTRLIRTRNLHYESLKELVSLRITLRLVLYVGMVGVVFSTIFLVDLFSETGLTAEPVLLAWVASLASLIVLGPMVMILLLLNRILSFELLDRLGTKLRTLGVALRAGLSVAGVGATLASILLLFVALILLLLRPNSSWAEALLLYTLDALLLLFSLFLMVLLLLPVGKAIPLGALKGAGATLRFLYIAVAVACTALLFWSLVTFADALAQADSSQRQLESAAIPLLLTSLFFVILGAIVVILLVLQGVRYIARRIGKTTTPDSTPVQDSRRHSTRRVRHLKTKIWRYQSDATLRAIVRYAGILFAVFYLTLFITFLYGKYLIWPLIDNINSISRSQSILDALYLYLIIAGGILSGALLYKGLFRPKEGPTEEDLLSAKSWRTFLNHFWQSTRPSPTWKWVAWSLTGAYVFSVLVGSLIAYLEEPPLPQVQVVREGDMANPEVSASTEGPGFHSSTKRLLSHADGYWYLLDDASGNLVVLPDQTNRIIQMPRYVDAVDERGSLRVEVPSEWGEHLSDYPIAWPEDPESVASSRLTVSTNVDNWGRGYSTPGTFLEIYSAEKWYEWWGKPVGDETVDQETISAVEINSSYCGRPDEGPAEYDLEDNEHLYAAKIVRWRSCEEDGGYFAHLVAVPKDQSFVLSADVQFPKDTDTAYDAETDRILRSIDVKSDLLP